MSRVMMNLEILALKILHLIILKILDLIIFYWIKSHTKIIWFMIFRAKLWLVQSLCVIGLIKLIDLLEFMMEIDI